MGSMVFNEAISDAHREVIAEHIVGQELLASKSSIMNSLNFWTREKAESSAEVDYIRPYTCVPGRIPCTTSHNLVRQAIYIIKLAFLFGAPN